MIYLEYIRVYTIYCFTITDNYNTIELRSRIDKTEIQGLMESRYYRVGAELQYYIVIQYFAKKKKKLTELLKVQ